MNNTFKESIKEAIEGNWISNKLEALVFPFYESIKDLIPGLNLDWGIGEDCVLFEWKKGDDCLEIEVTEDRVDICLLTRFNTIIEDILLTRESVIFSNAYEVFIK